MMADKCSEAGAVSQALASNDDPERASALREESTMNNGWNLWIELLASIASAMVLLEPARGD